MESHLLDHILEPSVHFVKGEAGNPISNVFRNSHMGKEGRFLKDITDPAARDREIHSSSLVEVDCSVHTDHARIWLNQSRDRLECEGLPGTRRPK